jgi:glutathione S-transferase
MSPDLDLYHGLASTCSKKVRLCLHEKGLTFRSHLLNLQAFEQHSPEYLKLNPNGVVPTLVHRGEPIVESNVIIEYIDDEFPNLPLRPADSLGRAKMRCWIQFSGEVAYDAVALPTWMKISAPVARKLSDEELKEVLARIPTKERRDRWARVAREGILEEEIEQCYADMARILDKVDQAVARGPWLAGETYSLADIAMIPFIDRIHNLRPDLCSPERYPAVADWYRRLRARPAFGPAFDFSDDPKVKGLPNI